MTAVNGQRVIVFTKNPYARRPPDRARNTRSQSAMGESHRKSGGRTLPGRASRAWFRTRESLSHFSRADLRISRAPFRGSVHYGVWVGAIPTGTSLLCAHAGAGCENCAGAVHGDDRRGAGSDGGGE